jgi:histone deacetylase complex regulatory component SIN3
MASRDYLIRQIEEMGYFLSILLRRILKMKEENQQEQMESVVREALVQELKMDIDQIVVLENEDFLKVIREHLTSEDQLEKLADILRILGMGNQSSISPTKANFLLKSLFLFIHLQQNSKVFSYERRIKILELQEIIRLKGL